MYCKKCGKEIKEGATFCAHCGARAGEPRQRAPEAPIQPKPEAPIQPRPEAPIQSDDRSTEKSSGGQSGLPLIITLAVIAAVVIAVVAAIMLYGGQSKKESALEAVGNLQTEAAGGGADEALEAETEETSDAPARLPKEYVEAEVLNIREAWNSDKEKILDKSYSPKNPEAGVTAYYNETGELILLESIKDKASDGFAKTYQYRNGKLIFAFYEAPDNAYRMYYKDGAMFRLDKRAGGDPVLSDAAYEDPEFLKWEKEGLEDGEMLYQNALNKGMAEPELKLVEAGSVDTAGLHKLSYVTCGETSHVQQPKYDNTAKVAMDDDYTTSWQEGVAGSGLGQQLWYNFDGEYQIRYIAFKLGNWRNEHYFYGNNRPSKLWIDIGQYTTLVEFPEDQEEYWIEIDPACVGKSVSFTIEDVYRGTGEFDDTCIAEIGVYGK